MMFRLPTSLIFVAATAALAGCATVAPGTQPAAAAAGASAPAGAASAARPGPVAAAGVSGAASAPSAAAGAASGPGSGNAAAAARPDPSAPRPFDEVIKGAKQQAGFVPVWRKDERVWLEIAPARLDQPFLMSVNISNSVGERGLYASMMGPSWLVTFRKVGSAQLQLVAQNPAYIASNPGMRAALEQSFSVSLLGSAAIASAPHPERKSFLVDASFLLTDLPAYSTALERAFRMPYGLDRSNSSFEKVRATDELTTLTARMHFGTARLPAPPLMPSPVPIPPPPQTLPDPRSMFIGFVYNFAKLPDTPMATRQTDPRLGHFDDTVTDLGDDSKPNPRRHLLTRWRLEKADPAAELSAPKKPIVYWLDKNIPPAYRGAVEAGVLEWNKAFEKIGFKNAIQVRQQPDDADWDNMDAGHASIRWFAGTDVSFAIGPSHSDPRTGEILDADIGIGSGIWRGVRRFVVEDVGASAGPLGGGDAASAPFGASLAQIWRRSGAAQCDYAQEAASELAFAMDLLEARGDLAPDSAEAEVFVQSVVKDIVMHEVGHTLGLKHNFKASTAYTRAQLQDKAFTAAHGITASVMDYPAYNLATRGEVQAGYNNTGIGPYDDWAIEYAYRTFANAEDEKQGLAKIAARSTEPWLAFGDDSDAGEGVDPFVNRFDLGDDPLAFYRKRLDLSRELWQRAERFPSGSGAGAGVDGQRQRRMLASGFRQLGIAADLVGKYVGGMQALRDPPGSSGRPAFVPVDAAKQREALQFLAAGLFNADSFRFKPEFLAGLAPDYGEWARGGPVNVANAVLQVQTVALDRMLSPGTAARVLNLSLFLAPDARRSALTLPEVYGTVQNAVWSELGDTAAKDIDPMRRSLQREHLKRLLVLLTRAPALPADALSLARLNATQLQAQLQKALARPGLTVETRAHLQDSLAGLTEALRASMQRIG